MSSKTLVMIYDQNDTKHGEISVMESPQKAARLVETLLEAGFERDRIRVFTGDEMGMQVTHRPVVALVDGTATPASETTEDAPAQPEAPQDEVAAAPATKSEKEGVAVAPAPKSDKEEVAVASAIPFTKDGVRFSSAFRPA
jgi:hypothetical protein